MRLRDKRPSYCPLYTSVSDRAYLTLSRALTGGERDLLILLEYDQSDRLSWVLSQNEDRTYAIDFRVRHAF